MANLLARSIRSPLRSRRDRGMNPFMEGLESRVLLYSALGDQWTYSSRITYSLMPDGTNIGGVPSVLYQTLNANLQTVSWKQQIETAASLWENVTNANLAMVSDGGQAVGNSGNQQDDPRFGDIRIGAIPLSASTLAVTFLPPPANGGTDAGDIILNSNVNWQIGSNYDLMTVVAHEFGHALGLGESTVSTAVMYGTYNGIKQTLASDDIRGIQSIYGTRQFDQFNTGGVRNNTFITASNINSFVNNAQIAIPGLDITTAGDTEWFYVNVPTTSTGTMSVSVQSSNLSSLSPKLQVYSSQLSLVGQAGTVGSLGATVSVSTSVQPGQGYYFKVLAAGGPGPIGDYGLLVNFGSKPQAPIPPPNTVVAQQPDQGGGTANLNAPGLTANGSQTGCGQYSTIGTLCGWAEALQLAPDWNGSTAPFVSSLISDIATALQAVAISTAGLPVWTQNSLGVDNSNGNISGLMPATGTGLALAVLQAIDETIDEGNFWGAGSQSC
jgi:Matrixin